jgi:hypothetical protein
VPRATERTRDPNGRALRNGALRRAIAQLEQGHVTAAGVDTARDSVRVEVLHHLTAGDARRVVEDLGGTFEGEVPGVLVQALVPADRLLDLERTQGVDDVRPPLPVSEPVGESVSSQAAAPAAVAAASTITGEEVAKTNAAAWQAAGFRGNGVKVGIIDVFSSAAYLNAVNAGEVPAAAGTFCKINGSNCNALSGTSAHGIAVMEIVHEMAPAATLYLARVRTTSDLQAAVNYFIQNGVGIVTRSLTSAFDGPGDGTGPIAAVIDNAVANGITWFNAAGNNAGQVGSFPGSYWRGSWVDSNSNGFNEFAPGDELMGFACSVFVNGLRWSDWGASKSDYDVLIFDNPGDSSPEVVSQNDQSTGAPPLEVFNTSCSSASDVDYLAIGLFSAGSGTAGDVLEFMTNGGGFEYWQNPYSASGPAADNNSAGGVTVGAVDPPMGTAIAPYSSRGPTNDDRIKPTMAAAACVASYSFSPNCFDGTSAATPAAAGAAALVREAGLAPTASKLKKWLRDNATVDRGAAGDDNDFGKGELVLPAPPAAAITIAPPSGPIGTAVTISGGRFSVGETVNVKYKTGLTTKKSKFLCAATVASDGSMSCNGTIPSSNPGAPGSHTIVAKGATSLRKVTTTFTLT